MATTMQLQYLDHTELSADRDHKHAYILYCTWNTHMKLETANIGNMWNIDIIFGNYPVGTGCDVSDDEAVGAWI